MAQPHKHAELIKAWADGAEIEYWDNLACIWVSCPNNAPTWGRNNKYRIKPHIEQRRYRVALFETARTRWTETADDQDEATYIEEERRDFHSWLTDWATYEVEVEVPEELL